ncbi:hypothetical protein [Sphingobacterium mizutaii]|uniref:hypothetical protein n=1 Tax=Sphingobacterium mizutaii TaxID=1010 RepID=UPI00162522BC|nr:hypothetical protein [Sphingobacterium mizutaii]
MKKKISMPIVVLLSLVLAFAVSSCSKDDKDNDIEIVEDKPGKIPGLGNTDGEPTGQKYSLPEGIELQGEITGYEGDINTTARARSKKAMVARRSSDLKAEVPADLSPDFSRGSGYFVRLGIKLKNSTSTTKKLELPAGLIIKSRSGDYQNGVLLKKVSIDIPANKTIYLDLHMYCGNEKKSASSEYEKYDLAVISNSSSLHDLINRLKNKKINIEQYYKDNKVDQSYNALVGKLQDILWTITDSEDGLNEDDIKYINEYLPND